MTVEQDNVALLREAYVGWNANKGCDVTCWMSVIHDDFKLASLADGAPEVPFTVPRNGREQVLEYLEGLNRDWEMVYCDIDDFVAQGDRVVAMGRTAWRHRGTGKVTESPKIDVWRIRDGKAVEFAEFYDTASMYAAATP
jgi:ketosteroid isomerase-like protein